MDTVVSPQDAETADTAPDLHCSEVSESVFVEPLESFMQLHGWDEKVVQRLDLLHLIALSSARATVVYSETVDALSAGDVLLVPPGMPFGLSCDADADGYVVALSAEQSERVLSLSPAFAQYASAEVPVRFKPPTHADTVDTFEKLLAVSRSGDREASLAVHAALCSTVAYLVAQNDSVLRGDDSPSSRSATALVIAFSELIERDFRTQRPLSDYCDALGVTERALRRATHKCHGQTPLQMIHARCVREAKRLLRFTNVSVAHVGSALGFDDPAYFNRFFKKAVGESPRAWRVARARH